MVVNQSLGKLQGNCTNTNKLLGLGGVCLVVLKDLGLAKLVTEWGKLLK